MEKEQYALLVDNLLRSYPYDIYCTGGTLANEVYHYCYERIKDKNRFFNFAAKTTVIEWFELIRGAVFHIGVDSGSIHVAASVGTQAFVLWEYGMERELFRMLQIKKTREHAAQFAYIGRISTI